MLYVAMLFLFASLLAIATSWRDASRAARAKRTPTSAISALGESRQDDLGVVELVGVVAAGPAGTFETPIGRKAAVLCRVRHEERGSKGWSPRSTAIRGVPFLVDDGTGATALVIPDGAVMRDTLRHAEVVYSVPSAVDDFIGENRVMAEYVDSRFLKDDDGRPIGLEYGQHTDRCVEDSLAPGDPIYALGLARRPSLGAAPYREGTKPPVVELFAGTTASGELLLSCQSELRFRVGLGVNRTFGLVFAVVGVVLLVIHFAS